MIPGAMDARYRLDTVHLVPYTQDSADWLLGQLRHFCKVFATTTLKPFHKYPIIKNFWDEKDDSVQDGSKSNDFDCSLPLNYTLNELQLMRLETRVHHRGHATNRISGTNTGTAGHGARSRVVRELLLGDVHTDMSERQRHRPTSFQEPLRNVEVTYSFDSVPPGFLPHGKKLRFLVVVVVFGGGSVL